MQGFVWSGLGELCAEDVSKATTGHIDIAADHGFILMYRCSIKPCELLMASHQCLCTASPDWEIKLGRM